MSIRARHILVKTKPKAEELLEALKMGEDFSELAKNNSECPSKKRGGDLGKFERGKMTKPFERAAFALKPGEISDVVKSDFGYHIIQRTDSAKISKRKGKKKRN